MLTRRDVLTELKRMGVNKPSLLKNYLRDFEKYIGTYYSFEVSKTKKNKIIHQAKIPNSTKRNLFSPDLSNNESSQ
jgi:hypothetical protein